MCATDGARRLFAITPPDRRLPARRRRGAGPSIGLVLGKPPQRSRVIPEVIARLRGAGVAAHVHVQDGEDATPAWADDSVDVVALRGLRGSMLRALSRNETDGTRFVDPPSALLAVRDRASVHKRLAAADIAVPAFCRAASWDEVRRLAGSREVVVKSVSGEIGRGSRVLRSYDAVLPAESPFPGPDVLEDRVVAHGGESKVYRFGRFVATALPDGTKPPGPERYRLLAERVAGALELSMCGIDILEGPWGPVVVDVNPFPSAHRIEEAVEMVSDHLLDAVAFHHDHPADDRSQRGRGGGQMSTAGQSYPVRRPAIDHGA
jgi:ribosomal protein S6--L-glutamate ligase